MKSLANLLFILTNVVLIVAKCPSCPNLTSVPNGFHKISYTESNEHIENPGRGFLSEVNSVASYTRPLSVSALDSLRQSTGITLIWRYFVLDTFLTSHISAAYLKTVDDDLYTLKNAGFTAIIRFCYTFKLESHAPYGDANKYWVMEHIKQLKPIIRKHEGVLTAVQAGFVGTWGEWYYTTYYGNPDKKDYNKYPKHGYPENLWQDRKDIVMALLDAVPKTIQVQLRLPKYKVDILNDATPTKYSDVTQYNHKARLGHHDDCFVSSDNDVGTYSNKTFEYPYLHEDSKYCIRGGETCRLTKNDRDECPTATHEMEYFHWTFLNQNFLKDILNIWKKQGCYEEVHRRLGYRFSLQHAVLPNTVQAGGNLCYEFSIKNSGYAASVKLMDIILVLRAQQGGRFYGAILYHDVRTWQPGTHKLQGTFILPKNLQQGRYDAYLAFGDKIIRDKSDYFILLANKNVPVYSAGYNNLHHSIMISGQHNHDITGCEMLKPWTPPDASRHARVFHGNHLNFIKYWNLTGD